MFGSESQDGCLAMIDEFLGFTDGILTKSHCNFEHDRKVSKMLDFGGFLGILETRSLAVNTNIL